MSNEVVYVEASGNHCGVWFGSDYLIYVYRDVNYGRIQQVPIALVPISRPHTDGAGDGVKER